MNTVMMEQVGNVLEFFDSGTLKLGLINQHSGSKVQITDQNGKQRKIPLKQAPILHVETVAAGEFSSFAKEFLVRVAKLQEEIDTALLWETVEEDYSEMTVGELAEIYFGESDGQRKSAILRSILGDPVHFKLRGDSISVRKRQQVEDLIKASERRKEKEALQQRTVDWIEELLSSDTSCELKLNQEQELVLRRIEGFLQSDADDEVSKWLSAAATDLSPKVAAVEVLSAAGKVPPDADRFLLTAGVEIQFSKPALDECARLKAYVSEGSRVREESESIFSIDDEDTEEIDDALTVRKTSDGFTVGIHIADVSHFVSKDDILDLEAFRRKSSLYLPQKTIRMFPDRLSNDLSSLRAGEVRPTVMFEVDFGDDLSIESKRIILSEIQVSNRLTYDEADKLLESEKPSEIAAGLALLDRATRSLLEERIEAGALVIRRPELKIVLQDKEIELKVLEPDSSSRRIVSELMILGNRLAAEYARDNGLPIIYRAQNPPSGEIPQMSTYDPLLANQIFSKLEPGKLSLLPQRHFGLGLDAYTQLTSPIRRYADLVLQRQLSSHLGSLPLPYDPQEMLQILGTLQAADADLKGLERRANRLYLLKYLEEHSREETMEAVIIRAVASGYLAETKDLFIKGVVSGTGPLDLGSVLGVRISKIDPERGFLQFTAV
jgi:exoribonuclease-2